MTPTTAYSRLRTSVAPHAALLSNSTSLIATSAVTSAFGFVFWWVAARGASATAVGQASAAVSAMTFLGTIGMVGLGTLLISELPSMAGGRWRLVSACVIAASAAGLGGGLIYVLLARTVLPGLGIASTLFAVVIVLGIVVTVGTLVLDDALIGMLAGGIQLARNATFAAGKLAVLAAAVATPVTITATEILGAWVAAAILSIITVAVAVARRGLGGSLRPSFGRLRAVRRLAMDHNLLNLALYLPRMTLPLIVTIVVSARANAGFYAAWMIVTVIAMIPTHFATTLFAVARDPGSLRGTLRLAMLVSLGIGGPLTLVVIVERARIMRIFGPQYVPLGAAALGILAATYAPTVVRQFYVAVARVTGRVRPATVVALGAGALEIGAGAAGGVSGGVSGLAAALLAVTVLEAIVMAPTVARCL